MLCLAVESTKVWNVLQSGGNQLCYELTPDSSFRIYSGWADGNGNPNIETCKSRCLENPECGYVELWSSGWCRVHAIGAGDCNYGMDTGIYTMDILMYGAASGRFLTFYSVNITASELCFYPLIIMIISGESVAALHLKWIEKGSVKV